MINRIIFLECVLLMIPYGCKKPIPALKTHFLAITSLNVESVILYFYAYNGAGYLDNTVF